MTPFPHSSTHPGGLEVNANTSLTIRKYVSPASIDTAACLEAVASPRRLRKPQLLPPPAPSPEAASDTAPQGAKRLTTVETRGRPPDVRPTHRGEPASAAASSCPDALAVRLMHVLASTIASPG